MLWQLNNGSGHTQDELGESHRTVSEIARHLACQWLESTERWPTTGQLFALTDILIKSACGDKSRRVCMTIAG